MQPAAVRKRRSIHLLSAVSADAADTSPACRDRAPAPRGSRNGDFPALSGARTKILLQITSDNMSATSLISTEETAEPYAIPALNHASRAVLSACSKALSGVYLQRNFEGRTVSEIQAPISEYNDLVGDVRAHLGLATGEHLAEMLMAAAGNAEDGALRGCERLADADLADLMAALRAAQVIAMEGLPVTFARGEILLGFRAIGALLRAWNQTPTQRATWLDILADRRGQARIFRNSLHNVVLTETIGRRLAARREAVIEGLAELGEPFYPDVWTPAAFTVFD